MRYTLYRPNNHDWIGGLIAFIIGIIGILYIMINITSADDTTQISNTKISRIEVLEQAVKELQEKNIELEERIGKL
jgi:hypothetical protein